jgi:hypothetical protein
MFGPTTSLSTAWFPVIKSINVDKKAGESFGPTLNELQLPSTFQIKRGASANQLCSSPISYNCMKHSHLPTHGKHENVTCTNQWATKMQQIASPTSIAGVVVLQSRSIANQSQRALTSFVIFYASRCDVIRYNESRDQSFRKESAPFFCWPSDLPADVLDRMTWHINSKHRRYVGPATPWTAADACPRLWVGRPIGRGRLRSPVLIVTSADMWGSFSSYRMWCPLPCSSPHPSHEPSGLLYILHLRTLVSALLSLPKGVRATGRLRLRWPNRLRRPLLPYQRLGLRGPEALGLASKRWPRSAATPSTSLLQLVSDLAGERYFSRDELLPILSPPNPRFSCSYSDLLQHCTLMLLSSSLT